MRRTPIKKMGLNKPYSFLREIYIVYNEEIYRRL